MTVLCVMETIQPLLIDLWINQIKQLLKQFHAGSCTDNPLIPIYVQATAPGFQSGSPSYFWADTFTRQASGFFHIDTESTPGVSRKPYSAKKMRNASGKIVLFPFVFLLILLDETGKLFRAESRTATDTEPAKNRYNPGK
jgi:hypothetical protein